MTRLGRRTEVSTATAVAKEKKEEFIDLTGFHNHKQKIQGKKITSTLGDSGQEDFTFEIIPENKGLLLGGREDEYSKYDPEGNADQRLITQGATILDSKIEITDSQGRNRTIARRNNNPTINKSETTYY